MGDGSIGRYRVLALSVPPGCDFVTVKRRRVDSGFGSTTRWSRGQYCHAVVLFALRAHGGLLLGARLFSFCGAAVKHHVCNCTLELGTCCFY